MGNEKIWEESLELRESICEESNLIFGSCESSELKLRIWNDGVYSGKRVNVKMQINEFDDYLPIGNFTITSDKPTADKKYRDIIAYDDMRNILYADVADWYNAILPNNDSTIKMLDFRKAFVEHFGLSQEDISLCNDEMIVEKTIYPSELSGKDVITAICEINGCFGHIGRDGKFRYIVLKNPHSALYPSINFFPIKSIYPASGSSIDISGNSYKLTDATYAEKKLQPNNYLFPSNGLEKDAKGCLHKKAQYEDYIVRQITKLQMRKEENDIGAIVGDGDNCYIVENNFLIYGKKAEDLEKIAQNLLKIISVVTYRPYTCSAKGNPCIEVGDAISIHTNNCLVESSVLFRVLKGIQSLSDDYSAEGEEIYVEDLDSTQRAIIELKGKGNILTRTVEETRSYIYDTEKKLSSEIVQNANEIALRVRKDRVISEINLTPETITISASRIDLVGIVNADTFISNLINAEKLVAKFATLEKLNADMVDVAGAISAVDAKFNSLNASNITSGTMSADRLDINGLINSQTFRGASLTVYAVYATTGFTYQGTAVTWGEINGQRVLVANA